MEIDIERYYRHFSERLWERYGVKITIEDYMGLWENQVNLFKKHAYLNISKVVIAGKEVFCLYWKGKKIMKTCYPPNLEVNTMALIRSCFGRRLTYLAEEVYREYLRECSTYPDLEISEQGSQFILNETKFPVLHFLRLQGKETKWDVMRSIAGILDGRCKYSKLKLVRR